MSYIEILNRISPEFNPNIMSQDCPTKAQICLTAVVLSSNEDSSLRNAFKWRMSSKRNPIEYMPRNAPIQIVSIHIRIHHTHSAQQFHLTIVIRYNLILLPIQRCGFVARF